MKAFLDNRYEATFWRDFLRYLEYYLCSRQIDSIFVLFESSLSHLFEKQTGKL